MGVGDAAGLAELSGVIPVENRIALRLADGSEAIKLGGLSATKKQRAI